MKRKPIPARPAMVAIAAIVVATTPLSAQTTSPQAPLAPAPAVAPLPTTPPPVFQDPPIGASAPQSSTAVRTSTSPLPDVAPIEETAPSAVADNADASEIAPAARRSVQQPVAATPDAPTSETPTAEIAAANILSATAVKEDKGVETAATEVSPAAAEPVVASEPEGGIDGELILTSLAGLLGVGAAGGVMAIARRRRRRRAASDAVPAMTSTGTVAPYQPVRAESVPAFTSTADPAETRRKPADVRRVHAVRNGSLIDQIDYSKPVGYYVSAVDQGPAPINPFLTRTNRLRRAHFLDLQLERAAARRTAGTPVRAPDAPRVRELEPA